MATISITITDATLEQLAAISKALSGHSVEVVQEPKTPDYSKMLDNVRANIEAVPTTALPHVAEAPPPTYSDSLAASVFGKAQPPQPQVNPFFPNVQAAPVADVVTAPQSAPSQPVAAAAGGMPGSAGVVLDSKGRPWDARIHGSGKTFLAKTQEWKLIRGVDPILVAQVNAELDGRAAFGQMAAVETPAALLNQVLPQTTPAGTYTPPPPAAPAVSYADVVAKVTAAIAANPNFSGTVAGLFQHKGIRSITDLANHPNDWAFVISEIDRLTAAQ